MPKTLVIVLHEIYGVNDHINSISDFLRKAGLTVLSPSLFPDKQVFPYTQSDLAYHAFMQEVGFIKASQQVLTLAKTHRHNYDKLVLLGFSIGATTAWLASTSGIFDRVVGFYGSRIRDFTDLKPTCPTLLFFPQAEQGFSVNDVIHHLSIHENVLVKQVQANHGFADPFSNNYCQEAADLALNQTLAFFKHTRKQKGTR